MRLPRHAEIWLPGYVRSRFRQRRPPADGQYRVWLAIADHYEPVGGAAGEAQAQERVARWERDWPKIAERHRDSAGRPAKYTFFYPQEEYRPKLIDALARMSHAGVADVEIHIHHDGEGEQDFVDRMSGFAETLFRRHGLLRKREEQIRFGFIHGNWALDNSLPDGRWCGLNNEITLLRTLGCYADFTMPSGASPTQASTVNELYWAVDDPVRPKSYDRGVAFLEGDSKIGLLMIPGPLGIRWRERLLPRIEKGEIAGYDLPTPYRIRRWLDLAPRVGRDIFIKLFTHGAQERNLMPLLAGGLDALYEGMRAECSRRRWPFFYVSCWEMFRAAEAVSLGQDPVRSFSQRDPQSLDCLA